MPVKLTLMWISARTAITLAAAAFLLVMFAVAAPLIPRPQLPSLPAERSSAPAVATGKFGAATAILEKPLRVRAQQMKTKAEAGAVAQGGAVLETTGRYGTGAAVVPSADSVKRLVALLKNDRTVSDPRASQAEATWVVRLATDEHKVDVMVDSKNDRLVVALDGRPVGSYGTVGLHREFSDLGSMILPPTVKS